MTCALYAAAFALAAALGITPPAKPQTCTGGPMSN